VRASEGACQHGVLGRYRELLESGAVEDPGKSASSSRASGSRPIRCLVAISHALAGLKYTVRFGSAIAVRARLESRHSPDVVLAALHRGTRSEDGSSVSR
jgi:hypothetical protein